MFDAQARFFLIGIPTYECRSKTKNSRGNIIMITDKDLKYLRRCIELAKVALEKGDQPFGSVLVSASGDLLAEDHNHVAGGDHTQHPEFNLTYLCKKQTRLFKHS